MLKDLELVFPEGCLRFSAMPVEEDLEPLFLMMIEETNWPGIEYLANREQAGQLYDWLTHWFAEHPEPKSTEEKSCS